jgi:hypothetical protein
VRGRGRRLAGGQSYDRIDLAGRNKARAPAARSLFLNAGDALSEEPPAPKAYGLPRDVQSLGDLDVGFAGSGL